MGAKKLKHFKGWDETHKDGELDSLGKIEEDETGYLKHRIIDIDEELEEGQSSDSEGISDDEFSDEFDEVSYEEYLDEQYNKEYDPDYDRDFDEEYIPHKRP